MLAKALGFLSALPPLFAIPTAHSQPQSATTQDTWRLVWGDEFDAKTLDFSKWRPENAALAKNNELQFYSPEALSISDGKLIITSSAEPRHGRPYTSGLVESRHKFEQAFGKFEIRAKLPATKGLWPAFWLLPEEEIWPPEIDIMEVLGHQPTKVYMSNHWGRWPNTQHETTPFEGPDLTLDFHTYACEWFPDRIDFFVDGVKRATHTQSVPQTPFYVILNTAVGGDWPGNPDATTVLPQTFEIDYVRVFEPLEPSKAYLNCAVDGEGVATPEPRRWSFAVGESVTLTASPTIGSRFVRWSGIDGLAPDTLLKNNPITLKLAGNLRVRAIFEKDPDAPQLISRGCVTSASSAENDALGAVRAVDGNLETRWSSLFSDPQWLTLDLGRSRAISTIVVHWQVAFGTDHEVQASDDSIHWRTLYSQTNGGGGVQRHNVDTTARYVRVQGTQRSTQWGYSIWELEVYGK